VPIEPESITALPEAPATFCRPQGREGGDDRGIASSPIYEGPVVRGPSHPDCPTGLLNRKAALRDQVRHDLPPLSRP
jgi:hypothetical protein